ncbi:MPN domain-containing protein [Entamoeba marina]
MSKCNHGPNTTCLNCLGKKPAPMIPGVGHKLSDTTQSTPQTSKPVGLAAVRQLTGNAPVQQKPKKQSNKPVKWLCQHPPGQKCSNCLCPKGAAEVKRKCNHPPNMRCPNCLPPEEKKQTEETIPQRIYFPSKCPNHGPHGSCTLCMAKADYEKIRITKQNAVCTLCQMNFNETNNFQRYVFERSFYVNRFGILYGTFNDNNVRVEAIYEPPQIINDKDDFELTDDNVMERVNQIALELGLERVGVIFSHNGKRHEILNSREVIAAAERQLKWDKRCVTVVVKPNAQSTSSTIECYQASSQLMEIVDKCIQENTQPKNDVVKLKETVYLSQKEIKEVESIAFVTNVPIKAFKKNSFFTLSKFPVENRPEKTVSLHDFKNHMQLMPTSPLYQQISDFHFIIFCFTDNLLPSLSAVKECITLKVEKSGLKADIDQWLSIPLD